jgi:hypothetical protein
MKSFHSLAGRCLVFALATFPLTPSLQAQPQVFSNAVFFTGNITLDGDISDFFLPDGLTSRPGVCVANDAGGLDESPLADTSAKDGVFHPSGFNQRRVMTAYRPDLNGGTIFVGIDLPGGTGANSASRNVHASAGNPNPNYFDGVVGANLGGGIGGRGKIVPFDADANGEADTIGRTSGGGDLFRCGNALPADTLDIVTCLGTAMGLSDNARMASGDALGGLENYVATVLFGNGQAVTAELYQDAATPPGIAQVRMVAVPLAPFGVRVSTATGGDGTVLGFDVEIAITNVNNAVPDECARLHQILVVDSGSNRDAAGQGEDQNLLDCTYVVPVGLVVTKICSPVPPGVGDPITFIGSVRNTGQVSILNLTVVNNRPAPNTPVFGPITLAPGATRAFTNSYFVPAGHTNCSITDILTASGTVCSSNVTASATATCPVPPQMVPVCLIANAVPPVAVQQALVPPIDMMVVGNLPISFLKTTLNHVPPGFGITNGTYLGWCVDYFALIYPDPTYFPILYLSTGPLPLHLQNPNWNKVNYILNHKQGDGKDIQFAIWNFIGGPVPPSDPDFFPPSATALAIIADANANGAAFVPNDSQIVAIILDLGPDVETTIIEYLCPNTMTMNCTPPPPAPVLVSVQALSAGVMKIHLIGQPNALYRVEGSENLLDWRDIATAQNINGTLTFTDPALPGQCFYRLVVIP